MRLRKIICIAFLFLIIADCNTGFHKGYYFPEEFHPNSASKLLKFTPTAYVHRLWSVKVGNQIDIEHMRFPPTVYGNEVFVSTREGYVKAIDKNSGSILWQKKTGILISTGVLVAYGKVFVATDNGGVVALDKKSGKILWKKLSISSAILATPIAADKMIFIKSIDGSLTALSEANGHKIWGYTEEIPSLVLHVSSKPAVYKHYIVSGFSDGHLVVLRTSTGEVVWNKLISSSKGDSVVSRIVDIDVTPVIRNGSVFVGSYKGVVVALNLKTGWLIWKHKISDYSGITTDHDRVYVSDAKSYIWSFDQDVGALLWRQKHLYYRHISSPVVVGRYIVTGDNSGYVHVMSKKTGKFAARMYLGDSAIVTTPVASDNNKVFVYTQNGYLHALLIKNILNPEEPVETEDETTSKVHDY